ncbi:ISAs1 family transposase [Nocardiopsis lucentensis]|uniref:ISAs1 family transposase n=1 Tax=Nocardiopsis lucentensis TaxID=53441 RepID=UPI0003493D6D|nr:ISAs1 family transposase [Nocardiopsis lucentensis]
MPTPPPVDLLGRLAYLDDPRSPQGRRHSLASVLLCALAAIVAGARHLRAIGQWTDAAPQHTLARLGCRITCPALGARTAPSPATIRRVLLALAPEALTALTKPEALQMVAVDGKTLRGSATPTEAAIHLLAALTPDRHLAAQVRVPAGTSEIDALAALLAGVDLTGVVVTADALHTQTDTATYLVEELHADYVLTVKRNQKALFEQVKALPWVQAPTLDITCDRDHGRSETRTVKVIDLAGATGFPHAVQAVRVRRHVTGLRTGKVSWTVAYAVTSLEVGQAGAARIGALVRGHWNIEAWHHVKDVSLGEDACKVHSGHAPDNLAALRALALVFLRRLGQDTVPDAIRWVSYEAFIRPLDVIGLP